MAIEIRQMVVKSNVQQGPEEREETDSVPDYEELRKSVLDACKRMVVELLQHEKER